MINFWNSVLGFLIFVSGILFMIYTTKSKQNEGKDVSGNLITMYGGAIGLIMLGLFLFLKELLKLSLV